MMVTSSTAQDELTLVRCAQAGDRAAFDVLADRYRALILAMTFLRTGSKDEAEDLTQDVFAKAWIHLPALKEPAAFTAWLKQIAANACRDWYRKAPWPESLVELTDDLPSTAADPCHATLKREQQSRLKEALLQLPELNRLCLLLHVWGQYPYARIAGLLGISLTTVEGRIYRARQQLKRLLPAEPEELTGEPRRQWHNNGERHD